MATAFHGRKSAVSMEPSGWGASAGMANLGTMRSTVLSVGIPAVLMANTFSLVPGLAENSAPTINSSGEEPYVRAPSIAKAGNPVAVRTSVKVVTFRSGAPDSSSGRPMTLIQVSEKLQPPYQRQYEF